jgi:hypothetical protein
MNISSRGIGAADAIHNGKIIDFKLIEFDIVKPKYKSYQCQRCGEYIGWLGRFFDWITQKLFRISFHDCKGE